MPTKATKALSQSFAYRALKVVGGRSASTIPQFDLLRRENNPQRRPRIREQLACHPHSCIWDTTAIRGQLIIHRSVFLLQNIYPYQGRRAARASHESLITPKQIIELREWYARYTLNEAI
ncbi:MAG: hypothetical protein IBX69_19100 [Anaerolineales bacterium]|nr:hypothetical protein [Anaerolineales bacterium]